MSTLRQSFKYTSKTMWVFVLFSLFVFWFLTHILKISRVLTDPIFFLFASSFSLYETFYSDVRKEVPIKNRLIGAMFAGAFVWQLIEASSKLFAKWTVWRFF